MRALWNLVKAFGNLLKSEPIGWIGVFVAALLGINNYRQQERFQARTDARFEAEQEQRQIERAADKADRQHERQEDKDDREPRLVDNGIRPPNVRPGRYEFTLRNAGEQEVAVRAVKFQYAERISTPSEVRETLTAAAGPIRLRNVCFNKSHFDEKTKTFTLNLSPPEAIGGGTNLHLEVCICEKEWAGERYSYKGSLIVIYDRNNEHVYDHVILDIVDPTNPHDNDRRVKTRREERKDAKRKTK